MPKKTVEEKKAERETKRQKNAHLWARDPDDYYVEPFWCNVALFEKIHFEGDIVDPCCGSGRILDAAAAAGYKVLGMDAHDRGAGLRHPFMQLNFFNEVGSEGPWPNIVCNPPYKYGEEFVKQAYDRTLGRLAVLLNMQWANAGGRSGRSRWLESMPLEYVLALSPRPSMPPGSVIEAGVQAGGGKTDYAWFIMRRGHRGPPEFGWVHRKKISE